MSGTESIFHAKGVCGDSPGYHPGTAQPHVFRPNGADGFHGVRNRFNPPNFPCAPLGRGTWGTGHPRVSPFAIAAYPVGDKNCGTIGDIMVFGQDQWAWGAHLRRAQRARRVRLRRKQPNQCNPTTWRLVAMNMAKSLPRQSETATGGIDFDFGKEPAETFTRDQHPDLRADFVMANSTAHAPASQLENRKMLNSSILCV